MHIYVKIWVLVIGLVGFEYWALTFHPELSLLVKAQRMGLITPTTKLDIHRGGTISLWLGWLGFGLMVMMNIYSIRRRLSSIFKWGRSSDWLNFHIFCGILGPTLILFHCTLKVRGVVGISFWSMMVSFSSGVVGRYIFLQMAQKKGDLDSAAAIGAERLKAILIKNKVAVEPKVFTQVLTRAVLFAGGSDSETIGPLRAFWLSFVGDLRLYFNDPQIPSDWPPITRAYLMEYAVLVRKANFLNAYRRFMGHWHAFHFPFAVFMYITAVIHIFSSLFFPTA